MKYLLTGSATLEAVAQWLDDRSETRLRADIEALTQRLNRDGSIVAAPPCSLNCCAIFRPRLSFCPKGK